MARNKFTKTTFFIFHSLYKVTEEEERDKLCCILQKCQLSLCVYLELHRRTMCDVPFLIYIYIYIYIYI